MSDKAKATFTVKNWDEKPYNEVDGGPKLSKAQVTQTYTGDIEGDASIEYLMVHRPDGSATFVGVEHVVGSVAGKSGSFVLELIGTFKDGVAKAKCRVVPGAGTGDLAGLRGDGSFESAGLEAPMSLDYEFVK